jgi:hypothetical protein
MLNKLRKVINIFAKSYQHFEVAKLSEKKHIGFTSGS